MNAAIRTLDRAAIFELAERLHQRAQSRLMRRHPELGHDLRLAAIVLHRAVAIGFPVRPIEVDEP